MQQYHLHQLLQAPIAPTPGSISVTSTSTPNNTAFYTNYTISTSAWTSLQPPL